MIDAIRKIFMGTSTTPRSIAAFVVREERPDPNKVFFEQKRIEEARAAERKILDNLNRERQQSDDQAYQKRQEDTRKSQEQRAQNSGGGAGGGYKPPGGSGGNSGSGGPSSFVRSFNNATSQQYAPDWKFRRDDFFKHGTPAEVVEQIQKKVLELDRLQRELPHLEQQRSFSGYDKDKFNKYAGDKGNYVGSKLEVEVALRILPHVTEFDKKILKEDRTGMRTDIDIGTPNFIVEVTAKDYDKRKFRQISGHLSYDTSRRDVILVAPNASPKMIREVEMRGGYYAKDADELVALMARLMPG